MAVEGRSSTQGLAAGPGARPPGTLRAIEVLLRVLALLVFAQPVFYGAVMDGYTMPWGPLHGLNGAAVIPLLMLTLLVLTVVAWRARTVPSWMPLTSTGMFLGLIVQDIVGIASVLWLHVPLGVAILGGVFTLMARVRTLLHSPTGALR